MPFTIASPTNSTFPPINNSEKALKVLFFIPANVDEVDIHHEFVTRLAHSLTDCVEADVVASAEKSVCASLADYDLLHIFGCWSKGGCALADSAYELRVPYVITPLGMLQPWEMEKHRRGKLLFNKQRRIVERATAINVCGKLEEQTFAKLGWNKRLSLIKNPVLTSQTTFDEVATRFCVLYRKVLDSTARLRISMDAQAIIGNLLQFGVDRQLFGYANSEEVLRKCLDELVEEEWRRIFIYASDEQVDDLLKQALDGLCYEYPKFDIASFERFDTQHPYKEGDLEGGTLLSHSLLMRNKVKDAFEACGKNEQRICIQLLNLSFELGHKMAPLRHLVNLYLAMRNTDMDEDMVRSAARQLGIDDFAQRIMVVLADLLDLTEGFMPFVLRRDSKATLLSRDLTKFGVYKTY